MIYVREAINIAKTRSFRVNVDNSEYEIYDGEKIMILELADPKRNKLYKGLLGEADSPKNISIGGVISICKLRRYNENWFMNDCINLYKGDKILLVDRRERITL